MTKRLTDIETDEVQLEVYECECGFHIGLDATYTEQVAEINLDCPVCFRNIETTED